MLNFGEDYFTEENIQALESPDYDYSIDARLRI